MVRKVTSSKNADNPDRNGKKLVIVESPTKAKTIRKFLGKDYEVESCMGHVRDLPQSAKDIPAQLKKEKWAKLGVNVNEDFKPLYIVPVNKIKVVKNLKDKLKAASEVYLATDEDREGESISWHLLELLGPKVPVKRMVFHEITDKAIKKALTETRQIDTHLVKAQEARRILDRLVGYSISPLLWKKVAFGLSAGRVQSVAVKLIVNKEHDRIRFKSAQYWGLLAQLMLERDHGGGKENAGNFEAKLFSVGDVKLATGKDFDPMTGQLLPGRNTFVLDAKRAMELRAQLQKADWQVFEIEEKPISRKPYPPFITSTLQQEANRKLHLSSRETMQVAQKLYEEGFITYMRTDSTFLSSEAIGAARSCIAKKFGSEYLPKEPIFYHAKKVKGAQEAHEAIRPAGQEFVDPEKTGLSGMQYRLYELIWMRTIASQMVDSRQKQVQVKIKVRDALFSASGMTIEFPGFLRAYVEGSDDPDLELEQREVRLPRLQKGQSLFCQNAEVTEHETKPPARYTEASLVQTLEKEGVGRPSTYASILGTIMDRGYVRKQGSALVPTFTAMVVSKLLENYLPRYVDLKFTSSMEQSLDDIAQGDLDYLNYLKQIYFGKEGLKESVEEQEDKIDPEDARSIRLDGFGGFVFKVGRFGAYVETKQEDGQVVSASIPENEAPADIKPQDALKWIDQKAKGVDSLGKDPVTGQDIFVLNGRFGPYVQLGKSDNDQDKPKRVSIPPLLKPQELDLKSALALLSLPKKLGVVPETAPLHGGEEIKLGIGRFGPYVVAGKDFRSIPKGEDFLHLTFERALQLISEPKKTSRRGKAEPLKDLGLVPGADENLLVMNGPYGPYLKYGKQNFSIPEGVVAAELNLEGALKLLAGVDFKPVKGEKAKGKKARKAFVKTKSKNTGEDALAAKASGLRAAKASGLRAAKASGAKKTVLRKNTASA